jgi:integrase
MSIRHRSWEWRGKTKGAWVVDYFDSKGKRRSKQFKTKREAEDFNAATRMEIKRGVHVADGDSISVAAAGKLWIETGREAGLVRSSREQCRQHLDLHITPFIGTTKLNKLTVPALRDFEGKLRSNGRSPQLTRKVLSSLGSIVADAMERGLAMHNPVREMRASRSRRRTKATRERKRKLVVGVDIPTPAEIRLVLAAATGYRRAFFATAALAGLRASELRGLRWLDVDLTNGTVTVRQRADIWGTIDAPKSETSERTVPLPPLVVNALKEWKLACPLRDTGRKDASGKPVKELWLVFSNGKGNVESHMNIMHRHWDPLQIVAGVSVPVLDDEGRRVPVLDKEGKPALDDAGQPMMQVAAKYSGLHALRHFYASWCAARPQDGGLGLPLKTVQARMGHSTLAMTADTYGHLFPSQDDAEVLAAGERALIGA